MLSDKYDFKQSEPKWRARWETSGVYAWSAEESGKAAYVIDTPPPTVSGFLHIGHVYSYTQTDLIARYQRMSGRNVFYPMGFDDNGLPTERLVEKTRRIRAADMTREEFIAICHEVVRGAEAEFRDLFKGISLSIDWSQEYRTIDPESVKISQMSALDLFRNDHLYRQLQPTLWDPVDRTALAQAEVVEKEMGGRMWEVAFRLRGSGEILVATTRPELIGACCALFVHPEHPRASEWIGGTATSPLFAVPVPVLADERADPEKGSGVVMCCTFGDTTDIEWWRDHELPTRVILDRYGRLTGMNGLGSAEWPSEDLAAARAVAAELAGLKVQPARKSIVGLLETKGLLRGSSEVVRMVPCAERSGAPLEILVTPQWFVRVLDKKPELLARGRNIRWVPEYMRVRYEHWIENLKWDWCISRQRYFGVPFPFWYSKRPGEEGRIIAAHVDDLPVNPLVHVPRGYAAHEVEPDADVMDTWATSSVTPQITSRGIADGMIIDPERYRRLFPCSLRPQAHEIIRTWAFYTILKSHLHAGVEPWSDIAISGWCLAEDHSKMSKSKGNVVTPERVLERYGADVVRYWTATSRLGLDTAFSEEVLRTGKRLVTKLWNASRFAIMQFESLEAVPSTPRRDAEQGHIACTLDQWILSRLSETVATATTANEEYRYADALQAVERFFWNDLCDNYLELIKARSYGDTGDAASRRSAQLTLWHCLETVLRLFAPVLPYATETIYSQGFPDRFAAHGSIHARGQWPRAEDQISDPFALEAGSAAVEILEAVRKTKSERRLSLNAPVEVCRVAPGPDALPAMRQAFEAVAADLAGAIAAARMCWVEALDGGALATAENRFQLELEFAEALARSAS
jgi:valyl-tRNA synthetase